MFKEIKIFAFLAMFLGSISAIFFFSKRVKFSFLFSGSTKKLR